MSLNLGTAFSDPNAIMHADKSVDLNIFTDNKATGGKDGTPFQFVLLDEGAQLTKIKVWKKQWFICAVEVEMSNLRKGLFGRPSGSPSEFTFRQGERIEHLKLRGISIVSQEIRLKGKTSTRVGLEAIKIKTTQNRSWGLKTSLVKNEKSYHLDVGSGICCGIFGASSDIVDRLGFAMIRPIKIAVISNVKYPKLDSEPVATEQDTMVSHLIQNDSSTDQTYILKGEKSITTTREWSSSSTLSTTIVTGVNAGYPKVISANVGKNWTTSDTATYKVSTSVTEKKAWDWPIKCPPNRQVFAFAATYTDKIQTEYIADVELELDNGKKYTYKEKGVYKGVDARKGASEIKDLGPWPIGAEVQKQGAK